ncbi:MAG: BrnA antitoxin family protein [Treponema sp.]|nr:BrnA antitoxin family protein [Treponema sp.]
MSTTVTMTLDEIMNLPPLSEQQKKELETAKDSKITYDEDSPEMTADELKQFKPWYEVHPEWYKVKKADIHLKIDIDILEALKSKGKGYQTRINDILRKAVSTGQF